MTHTRSRTRPTRRISPCYRHPDDPNSGICASCLRDRLSGLHDAAPPPELRRCRSVVSLPKCEEASCSEPRRRSCDARSSLSNLFDVDDDSEIGSGGVARVESKNVGLSRVTYTVIEPKRRDLDGVRVLGEEKLGEFDVGCGDSDGGAEEGGFRTMKEYIDLEFGNRNKKSKDLREIAGSFLGVASVFSKKLRKWKQKNSSKTKNRDDNDNGKSVDGDRKLFENGQKLGEKNHAQSESVERRRSCDTEPRFSTDGGRISFEEPRASWDGYMIARTIPRLAPMFSLVENGILGDVNNKFEHNRRLSVDGPTMHSIVEDESSSGASGSGHSNSDSSFSMRRSSFDRSSSVRSFGKKVTTEDHGVVLSPANVKLVITEKELKDWRLSRGGDNNTADRERDRNKLNVPEKKSVRWRRVCKNVFGFKLKNSENVCESETFQGNVVVNEKQGNEVGGLRLARCTSVVGSRNTHDVIGSSYNNGRRSVDNAGRYALKGMEDFKLERIGFSPAALDDNSVMPFYMTPLRSLRNSKSGKFQLVNSHSIAGN